MSLGHSLKVFFDLVLTGAALCAPVYASSGQLVDFRFVRLNPAGQRLLGLPAQPLRSFREYYPRSVPYVGDGFDTYFRLVAQRSGERLMVNFTDTNDQPHSAVEDALRASQAREQAALAEDERQRALLYRIFEEAPAMICILQGPEHVFQFANAPCRALVGERPLLGRPFAEAFAELVGQGIMEPLNEVYRPGEPYYASEQLARIDHTNSNSADCA